MQATGIPTEELAARRETLLQHIRARADGYVLFDQTYIQYLPASGSSAPSGPSPSRGTPPARWRSSCPSSRSSGSSPRRLRAGRVLSRVPGHRAPDAHLRARAGGSASRGAIGADQDGYPGILGYRGPALSEVTGSRSSTWRRHRELDGAQERRGDRPHPGERALVRRGPPGAAAIHAAGRDGGGGEPARGPGGHARDAARAGRCVRRPAGIVGRRDGGLPRADRAPQLVGARDRAQHRVPGGRRAGDRDERADLGLQRGARARDDRRPAERRAAATVRAHGRRPAGRLRGPPPRRHVRGRRQRGHALPRGRDLQRYWRQHTGHAIGLRNHEAPFLDLGDVTVIEPAWSSPSSPASTTTRSAASATPTPSW